MALDALAEGAHRQEPSDLHAHDEGDALSATLSILDLYDGASSSASLVDDEEEFGHQSPLEQSLQQPLEWPPEHQLQKDLSAPHGDLGGVQGTSNDLPDRHDIDRGIPVNPPLDRTPTVATAPVFPPTMTRDDGFPAAPGVVEDSHSSPAHTPISTELSEQSSIQSRPMEHMELCALEDVVDYVSYSPSQVAIKYCLDREHLLSASYRLSTWMHRAQRSDMQDWVQSLEHKSRAMPRTPTRAQSSRTGSLSGTVPRSPFSHPPTPSRSSSSRSLHTSNRRGLGLIVDPQNEAAVPPSTPWRQKRRAPQHIRTQGLSLGSLHAVNQPGPRPRVTHDRSLSCHSNRSAVPSPRSPRPHQVRFSPPAPPPRSAPISAPVHWSRSPLTVRSPKRAPPQPNSFLPFDSPPSHRFPGRRSVVGSPPLPQQHRGSELEELGEPEYNDSYEELDAETYETSCSRHSPSYSSCALPPRSFPTGVEDHEEVGSELGDDQQEQSDDENLDPDALERMCDALPQASKVALADALRRTRDEVDAIALYLKERTSTPGAAPSAAASVRSLSFRSPSARSGSFTSPSSIPSSPPVPPLPTRVAVKGWG